jgi:hypothetical protein
MSGGNVTTRHTEPPGGGLESEDTFAGSVAMRAGVRSVAQTRLETAPGWAGSGGNCGAGPSAIARDLP